MVIFRKVLEHWKNSYIAWLMVWMLVPLQWKFRLKTKVLKFLGIQPTHMALIITHDWRVTLTSEPSGQKSLDYETLVMSIGHTRSYDTISVVEIEFFLSCFLLVNTWPRSNQKFFISYKYFLRSKIPLACNWLGL